MFSNIYKFLNFCPFFSSIYVGLVMYPAVEIVTTILYHILDFSSILLDFGL